MQGWTYIAQLNFSADFDRLSLSSPLFKLKSIGVGGNVLSICTEVLSDRRQRVVVDGASSEWIPIISGVPQGSVLGPLLFILYATKMFELVENRRFAYADDTTLLAVVNYWPPLTTRDLASIQEWSNHSCMIQNLNKTKASFVSRSRTVSLPMVTWSCLEFLSGLVPTSTSLT